MSRSLALIATGLFAYILLASPLPADAATKTVILREHLNRDWAPEVLTYPFTASQASRCLPASLQVSGPAGPVPAQFIQVETWPKSPYIKSATLALVSGLRPRETKTFKVTCGATKIKPPASDLSVKPGAGVVAIETSLFGLRLLAGTKVFERPQASELVPGPVVAMRQPDGRWFGGSRMYGARKILGYEAAVIEQGPALARWRVLYRYEGGTELAITIDLGAGRARADWETSVTGNAPEDGWKLLISPGLEPLLLFWRPEYHHNKWGSMKTDWKKETGWDDSPRDVPLATEPAGLITRLTPWADWWDATTQIGWTFRTGPEKPVFCVRRIDAGAWVEPEAPGTWATGAKLQQKMIPLVKEPDGAIAMHISNVPGLRRWESGSGALGEGDAAAPPKYCYPGFSPSLNTVKDWVLDWRETKPFPRLYVTRAQLESAWKRADPVDVEAFFKANVGGSVVPSALHPWTSVSCLNAWLMAGTKEMAQRVNLAEHARYWLARGGEEHFNTPKDIIGIYDGVMTAGILTPEDTALFRAQMAYLAYALDDPATWSIERGYCSGNEDMTVARIVSKGFAACVLPEHPRATAWAADGLRMTEKWLAKTGPGGEWPESASGYAIPSTSDIFMFALAAYRAGLADFLHDPRMKRMIMCTAKQYSPPDPREGGALKAGTSQVTPVGDAIAFGSGVIGQMACAVAAEDPAYASALQWVWKRSGMTGAHRLVNPDLPAKTPDWSLDVFPRLGTIIRGGLDTGKEDFLYLVTSDYGNAFRSEAGSITAFFSKGVPLVHSFLGRYSYRQTSLSNRVCLGMENPTAAANQPKVYRGGHYHGIWNKDNEPPAIFGERPGPSTTAAASDLPCQAYVMADMALRQQEDMPMSEKIEDLPAWPALVGGYGKPPLDWRRQLLFLKGDVPGGNRYLIIRDTVKGGVSTRWQLWNTSEKIGTPEQVANREAFLADKPGAKILPARELPRSNRYTAVGRFGVDLEYYIASPIDTPRHTLRWGITYTQYNSLAKYPDYQDLLHLQLAGDGAYFVALFPRKTGDPSPTFFTLGNGHIIKVRGTFGTDYAFLSALPVEASGDGVAFNGTAASVQNRGGQSVLSLGAKGAVQYQGVSLAADFPASLRVADGQLTVELPEKIMGDNKSPASMIPFPGGSVTLAAPGNWTLGTTVQGVKLEKTAAGWALTVPSGIRQVRLTSH
ncbi:MAG: hypothetical protein ACYC7E_09485 [Armatimonadota bacterium]